MQPSAQAARAPDLGIPAGIRARLKYIFWMLAKSDNRHDFGSTKMKELFDAIPLESSQTFKNRLVAVSTLRLRYGDFSVYDFFKDHIHKIFSPENLYLNPNPPNRPDGTVDVTDEINTIDYMIGVKMHPIKTMLRNSEYNHFEDIRKTNTNLNGVVRNYVINAVRYKRNHKRSCLSKAIKTLIGGNDRITLIVDASNLKMTELRKNAEQGFEDPTLDPEIQTVEGVKQSHVDLSGPAVPLTVNLLSSSENKSDSAGKIGYDSYVKGENNNVNIFLYEDIQDTLSYPLFASEEDPSQNANIYASIPFTTHRLPGGETVRGEFVINDTTKVVVDDLKNESQIATASFKAVQLYLEAYGRGAVGEVKMKEILVNFLIKRIGDWAQGLCLLDLYRIYKLIEGEGHKNERPTLQAIKGTGELGVLTHDQVLLSYCILIGVDVFFTIHFPTGDHWLLHFKNSAAGGRTDEGKLKEEIAALGALEKSIQNEIVATTAYIEKTTAEATSISTESFGNYIEQIYLTSSNLQNTTPVAKLNELLTECKNMLALIDGMGLEDELGQRKVLSSSTLRAMISNVITQNTHIRNTKRIPEREGEVLDNLINAIRRGGNVTVTIAYQNYMEKLVYPIRDSIKAVGIRYPLAELTQESFGEVGRRVAYMTDNLKNLKKTLDIMLAVQAGGGRETLKDIFYDIRDRSIIVLKKRAITSEADVSTILPVVIGGDDALVESRNQETTTESSLENFKAIQGEYVSDRNMNLYSVLDRYLITEDDRHKFQHLDDVPVKTSYKFNYCVLRRFLLDHDKLYSNYIKLKAEYSADLEDKETTIYRDLKHLYLSVEELGKAARSEISTETSKNRYDITHAIGRRLAYIRYNIFKSYMSKSIGAKYSYLKLDEIETEEATTILHGLREDHPLKRDYQEFKDIDKQEQEAIENLISLGAMRGGRRRTRRAKKHPKRKTRRHKK